MKKFISTAVIIVGIVVLAIVLVTVSNVKGSNKEVSKSQIKPNWKIMILTYQSSGLPLREYKVYSDKIPGEFLVGCSVYQNEELGIKTSLPVLIERIQE